MMLVLNAIWGFLKKNWQAVLLVVVVAVGVAWFKHQQSSYAKTITDLNASHQQAIDQINAARQVEDQQHAQEVKDLQDKDAQIEKDYDAAKAALETQTTQEQQQIVQKYGHDADGLAALLASKFGFAVVKP